MATTTQLKAASVGLILLGAAALLGLCFATTDVLVLLTVTAAFVGLIALAFLMIRASERTAVDRRSNAPTLNSDTDRHQPLQANTEHHEASKHSHLLAVESLEHRTPGRPLILHVDDDRDVLDLVAGALEPFAHIVSVESVGAARRAIATYQFDLAVLDITLGPASGWELLPDLRHRKSGAIPVIVFSSQAAIANDEPQVDLRLDKSRASLHRLVARVRDRLSIQSSQASMEVA